MATTSTRFENIQTTMGALNADFAGRRGTPAYNDAKPLHIHRRNRAYVWSVEMEDKLLDSMRKRYPIPPIYCCLMVRDGRLVREIMDGGNRTTAISNLLARPDLTPADRTLIETYPINMLVMQNLDSKEQREMFRRLNKSVKVSDGQLYAMSEDDSPLIQEATQLLTAANHPLRAVMDATFGDLTNDKKARRLLSNAVALISGALNGVNFLATSFNVQEPKVEDQTPPNRAAVVATLTHVFEPFRRAQADAPLTRASKMRDQFNVGKFIGAILYDILTAGGNAVAIRAAQDKWTTFLVRFRRQDAGAADAAKITGAQNLTPLMLRKKSKKVEVYVRENRVLTDAELEQLLQAQGRPEEDTEGDADSYTDDESEDGAEEA